jgi:TfoX/Sxy family transcriptional regulator of competence genes
MGYDERLLERVRKAVARRKGVTESKLFGGVAVMLHGNMACAIRDDELYVRLGENGATDALKEAHVRPMDITGRPMKSYVTVGAPGIASDAALKAWIDRGLAFARTLPAKEQK